MKNIFQKFRSFFFQQEGIEREKPSTMKDEIPLQEEEEKSKPVVEISKNKESKKSRKQRRQELHAQELDRKAKEKELKEQEWIARRRNQEHSNLPSEKVDKLTQHGREKIFGNIDNCLKVLIPYGGEFSKAKRMYKICVDHLMKNPNSYYKIEIIELSIIDNCAVVAICGQWDELKGLELPWGEGRLDPSCDIWSDGSGFDNYKTRYLRNTSSILEATNLSQHLKEKLSNALSLTTALYKEGKEDNTKVLQGIIKQMADYTEWIYNKLRTSPNHIQLQISNQLDKEMEKFSTQVNSFPKDILDRFLQSEEGEALMDKVNKNLAAISLWLKMM